MLMLILVLIRTLSLQIRYDTFSEADITSAGIRYHF